jgi:hypothetical protein
VSGRAVGAHRRPRRSPGALRVTVAARSK